MDISDKLISDQSPLPPRQVQTKQDKQHEQSFSPSTSNALNDPKVTEQNNQRKASHSLSTTPTINNKKTNNKG